MYFLQKRTLMHTWSPLTLTECCICGHLVWRSEWPASLGCTCSPDEIGQQPLPFPAVFPAAPSVQIRGLGLEGWKNTLPHLPPLPSSRNRLLGSKDRAVFRVVGHLLLPALCVMQFLWWVGIENKVIHWGAVTRPGISFNSFSLGLSETWLHLKQSSLGGMVMVCQFLAHCSIAVREMDNLKLFSYYEFVNTKIILNMSRSVYLEKI